VVQRSPYRGRIGDGVDLENERPKGGFERGIYGVRCGDSGRDLCGRAGKFFEKKFLKSFWKIFLARKKFWKKIPCGPDELFFAEDEAGHENIFMKTIF
jgi:hypothetical protein